LQFCISVPFIRCLIVLPAMLLLWSSCNVIDMFQANCLCGQVYIAFFLHLVLHAHAAHFYFRVLKHNLYHSIPLHYLVVAGRCYLFVVYVCLEQSVNTSLFSKSIAVSQFRVYNGCYWCDVCREERQGEGQRKGQGEIQDKQEEKGMWVSSFTLAQ
jgi:hypothetical protein